MSGTPTEEEFLNEIMEPGEQVQTHERSIPDDPAPVDQGSQVEQVAPVPANEPRMVDVRAVQEARAAERAIREEYAREKEARIRLEERTNALLQRLQPQPEPPPAPPSEDEDIVGYLKHEVTTAKQEAAAIKAAFEQQQQAQRQQQEVQNVVSQADRVYEVARTKYPDVNEAFQFAVQETVKDIIAKGYQGAAAEQAFNNVLLEYAVRCPPDPEQAADFIRRTARWWGWGGPQAQQAPTPQNNNIQDLASRTERHMSLSGVSGAEAPRTLDARALAAMSDEEFFKLADRLSDTELDKLMGAA